MNFIHHAAGKWGGFGNPKGVVITQLRVGVATPTLGGLHVGSTLKGLYQGPPRIGFNSFRVGDLK